jgi:hypothetical protein
LFVAGRQAALATTPMARAMIKATSTVLEEFRLPMRSVISVIEAVKALLRVVVRACLVESWLGGQ